MKRISSALVLSLLCVSAQLVSLAQSQSAPPRPKAQSTAGSRYKEDASKDLQRVSGTYADPNGKYLDLYDDGTYYCDLCRYPPVPLPAYGRYQAHGNTLILEFEGETPRSVLKLELSGNRLFNPDAGESGLYKREAKASMGRNEAQQVAGTYVNPRDKQQYCDIFADGTFYWRDANFLGMYGKYRIKWGALLLIFEKPPQYRGRALKMAVRGDRLVKVDDPSFEAWIKR